MEIKGFESLIDIMTNFSTEEKCIKYYEKVKWGDQVVSPYDPQSKVYACKNHRYKCKNTGKFFNVKTGTIFHDSKISMVKWFMSMYFISIHKKGISSHQLAKNIGVTQPTAWYILQRIREGLGIEYFRPVLNGVVEIDETFVGGKNKNRHWDKKVEKAQGRAFKDKTPVMGMLQRGEHEIIPRPNKIDPSRIVNEKVTIRTSVVVCKAMKGTKVEDIHPVVMEKVKPGSALMTDEWKSYNGLEVHYNREFVHHGRGEYVSGNCFTNTLEGFWSHCKRAIIGVYHWVSVKHLDRYMNEFAFRYNTRNMKTSSIFELFLQQVDVKLQYKTLIDKP